MPPKVMECVELTGDASRLLRRISVVVWPDLQCRWARETNALKYFIKKISGP